MPVSALCLKDLGIESPFLEGLPPSDVESVIATASTLNVHANTVITRQGAPADHFYMLLKGRARYFINTKEGQKLLMMWVVPGGVIGSAAVTRKFVNYAASTEAVRDSTLLCWDRAMIRELAHRYPRLLDNSLSIAAEYLTWSIDTFIGLTSHTAPERLVHILLGLVRLIGKNVNEGIELDVTNEELASGANITPYTTSRLLSRWQKQGLVRKLRGRIIVQSPEKLAAEMR